MVEKRSIFLFPPSNPIKSDVKEEIILLIKMPSQLIYPAVEGDGNEYSTKVREKIDKDYFQNRFDTIESQVVTILKSVAPLENPVRIDTARDWFTYQLKTFNWLNLGVVLVLFFSLQMIQHQTASNQSTLLGIKKQELVLLAQQDELKNSVTLAQYQVENVTKTNTEFFFKAHKAMADLHTANLSSTAHLYSLYETMVTNLQQLNQSSYKLFEEARERVGHSMKQTIIKSGSGNFTLSTNPSPLYIKVFHFFFIMRRQFINLFNFFRSEWRVEEVVDQLLGVLGQTSVLLEGKQHLERAC